MKKKNKGVKREGNRGIKLKDKKTGDRKIKMRRGREEGIIKTDATRHNDCRIFTESGMVTP